MAALPLYFHPLYTDAIDPGARFPRARYRMTRDAVLARDEARAVDLRTSPFATRDDLWVAHAAEYVDAFLEGRLDPERARRIGLQPWTPDIVPRTLALVGGTLAALRDAAASGGLAANMAGGTHHAHFDHGGGYCVVNDLVIAARIARRDLGLRRVLIVDLDVHHGDGTATLCARDPFVFTFSIHGATNWPFEKPPSDLDVALPRGTGDEAYLDALRHHLPQALDFGPDLVLFQAGVDPLAEDRLGHLDLSRAGLRARNEIVLDATTGIPTVVLMGGGYAQPIERTADAFADLFLQCAEAHVARTGLR